MTSIKAAIPKFAEVSPSVHAASFPEAEVIVPTTVDEVAEALAWASAHDAVVVPMGGGTHQGFGRRPDADVVMDLGGLARVEAWEPEDLTVVVEAGVRIADLEAQLATRNQTALLSEHPGHGTVGGAVAAGISGYRRGRYGPTRDRVLEVTLVTGDGRRVRGGARVVKNVTGYDLPRLVTGSLGSLGVITSVCLKLWPVPAATATVRVEDHAHAVAAAWKPLAILQQRDGVDVFLGGTAAEVEAQIAALGGVARDGLAWPEPPSAPTGAVWSLRVPPDRTAEAVERLPGSWRFVAQHGVGEVSAADDAVDVEAATRLRSWAEDAGGAMVLVHGDDRVRAHLDPWGTPPPTLGLQRRLVARFDPDRVVNRGRLPGGI